MSLSERDKDIFASKWRDRQRKAEPYRYVERRGFLREHWGLITLSVILITVVGACIYDQIKK